VLVNGKHVSLGSFAQKADANAALRASLAAQDAACLARPAGRQGRFRHPRQRVHGDKASLSPLPYHPPMPTPERPTATVRYDDTGDVYISVTVPGPSGPVTLALSVVRDEETDTWRVLLPLWPASTDVRSDFGVVSCLEPREDAEETEDGHYDPADCDEWEVMDGCATLARRTRQAGTGGGAQAST